MERKGGLGLGYGYDMDVFVTFSFPSVDSFSGCWVEIPSAILILFHIFMCTKRQIEWSGTGVLWNNIALYPMIYSISVRNGRVESINRGSFHEVDISCRSQV